MSSNRLSAANPSRNRRAFTLVEIMVVIVIVGLLAGVVTVNVRGYLIKAKQNIARQEIATIKQSLESFYTLTGAYPTNEQGIEMLTKPTEQSSERLLDMNPTDPWGRSYQYIAPGPNGPYEVVCYGADGREGGQDADSDLSSDNLKE